jgi:hypothetical protein
MAEVEFTEEEAAPSPDENPLRAAFMKNAQKMERPIPGQSLTNDPEAPLPFEQPPRFVDKTDALEYLFASFVEEKKYLALMGALEQGMPIMDLTKLLLVSGFQDGLWNYDLLLILIEPAAYMIMALAERAGVEFQIINPEEDDEADEEELYGKPLPDEERYRLGSARKTRVLDEKIASTMSANTLPTEIAEKIQDVEVPQSLMEKP